MDELVAKKKSEITSFVNKFCEKYLNNEYRLLCEKVILKLSRKRRVLLSKIGLLPTIVRQ